jgi:hypothetical protein
MDYTPLTPPPLKKPAASESELAAGPWLYEALRSLPDPRRGQGKRYEWAFLLCLLFLAKLAGQTSLKGATEWIGHRGTEIAAHFGLKRTQMPCDSQ